MAPSGLLDLLGWVGGGLVAVAYVLASTRRVLPDAVLFQGLNMVGAGLLGVASFHSGALPSAVMNLTWILVGLQSLAMVGRRRRRAASTPPCTGRNVASGAEPGPLDSNPTDVVMDAA